jgi:hypothetical protein
MYKSEFFVSVPKLPTNTSTTTTKVPSLAQVLRLMQRWSGSRSAMIVLNASRLPKMPYSKIVAAPRPTPKATLCLKSFMKSLSYVFIVSFVDIDI